MLALAHRLAARALLALVIAAAATLAAGCLHTRLTCPAKGGQAWIELGSPHLILRTDHASSTARATLEELELRVSLLSGLVFESLPSAGERLVLVLFEDREEFGQVFPELVNLTPNISMVEHEEVEQAGFFTLGRDLEETPTIVTCYAELEVLQHELVHWLVRRLLPQAPTWLNEGLAQFYSTLGFDLESREAIVGRPPWSIVARGKWPTVEELITADSAAFYDHKRVAGFYSAAWMMIRLLLTRHANEFAAYRKAVRSGQGTVEAWRVHLGADWAAWDRELRGYLLDVSDRPEQPLATRSPLPAITLRDPAWQKTLADEDVHLLWAQIRDWRRPESQAQTQLDLDEAARLAPDSPEPRFWQARFDQARGRGKEAEAVTRAALAKRPDDPKLRLVLGQILVLAEERKSPGERRLDELGPTIEAVRKQRDVASALSLVARYELLRDQPSAALEYAQRAVTLAPSHWRYFDRLASIYSILGRASEAVEAERRAIGLLPEQEVSRDLLEKLRKYRENLTVLKNTIQ